MPPTTKIFLSYPSDHRLTARQISFKQAVIQELRNAGYEPQGTGPQGLGLLATTRWSYAALRENLGRCQGAVMLGLACLPHDGNRFPSEWNHFEGAVARELELPLFIIREDDMSHRGIFYDGEFFIDFRMQPDPDASEVATPYFQEAFKAWRKKIDDERYHVFLGYSSGAESTAQQVYGFLTNTVGIRVRDWKKFSAGSTILDQIEKAKDTCMGGVFLFTQDDKLETDKPDKAAPRDNVVFEAGYFMSVKGKERTLIIREEGSKLPADVGGIIYLTLDNRHDISPIEDALTQWVNDHF